ncbi:MFS transporter [Vulcanisaeta distributa]|uniref:Major facilitator superfamily MFS_1 n=1 Tax=Vulcanisaeta distributa (strain DSM 14429 / JCM 11212 / NBRC 100878 / IC-017) TaxID=572478 RepID=E1QQQ9_VULDI|nr:MFS transporter [Vulcanisaeta distributa]ADN51671.1 major facilitator superfamily MFS_1 [Vulcanisaeta distributa DSM 14429]
MGEATKNLRLSGIHYVMFFSYSLTFLIWGFVTTSGVMSIYYFSKYIPKFLVPISVVLGPISLMIGNVLMGRLADIVGRRGIYVYTMSLYTIGLIGMGLSILLSNVIPASEAFIPFIISYILAEIGVGGEEPPALAAATELMPYNYRGSMLVLITNFDNIGAAIASAILLLALMRGTQLSATWTMIGSAIIVLIAAIIIRLVTPESVRWLIVRGRVHEAERIANEYGLSYTLTEGPRQSVRFPPLWFRTLVLSLLGISQLATYGLMAFYIVYLPSLPFSNNEVLATQVLLWANVGASIAGLIGLVIDRLSRKTFTLISFLGGLLTMIPIFIIYGVMIGSALASSLTIFYTLLFLNMIFSEFGWAVRVLLEPELYPTRNRATWVGIVRLIAWIMYVLLIYYLLASANTYVYLLSNLILYIVGFLAALAWFIFGVETKGLSVHALDKAADRR